MATDMRLSKTIRFDSFNNQILNYYQIIQLPAWQPAEIPPLFVLFFINLLYSLCQWNRQQTFCVHIYHVQHVDWLSPRDWEFINWNSTRFFFLNSLLFKLEQTKISLAAQLNNWKVFTQFHCCCCCGGCCYKIMYWKIGVEFLMKPVVNELEKSKPTKVNITPMWRRRFYSMHFRYTLKHACNFNGS